MSNCQYSIDLGRVNISSNLSGRTNQQVSKQFYAFLVNHTLIDNYYYLILSNLMYYKYRLFSCTNRRCINPFKVWSQLTWLSGNSVLHQHVVHYNSVSFYKEDAICRNTLMDIIWGVQTNFSNKSIHTKMSIHIFLLVVFIIEP